jgi:lysophospholipase L1-like esterase
MNIKITLLLFLFLIPSLITAQQSRTEYWKKRANQFKNDVESMDTNKVVFLGNSITEGFDLELYFPESKPVNRGISGDNINGVLERFDYSVRKLKPSKLFLMIGINDIGTRVPDSLIQSNYQLLLRTILKSLPHTRVYIQSILPTTAIWANCPVDKIQRMNKLIQEFSIRFGFTWIDLYSKFATEDGYLRKDFTNDGLHLNSKGYVYWSTILKKYGLE